MKKLTFHLLSNAHLDPVWFWDWREGLNEGIKTCRSMAALLEEFPFLRFSRGEAVIYRQIERFDPELFEKIRAFHRAGRWDIVGGNLVQPDQNMPDTATQVRQFQLGQRYFRETFGTPVKTAWSADCFGHSAGMPEIFRLAGFENFCFSRPAEAQLALPDDLFYWEGPGGSRILSCRLAIGWYGCGRDETLRRLDTALERYADSPRREIALGMGLGDHGGGTTRRQIRETLAWAEAHPEVEVRFSTFTDYFNAARQEIAAGFEPPAFRGELNFCLRGCYSSATGFKYRFRRAEATVRRAERSESVIRAALGQEPRDFHREWNDICFNTFHDILPGSSIERAYEEQSDWIGGAAHSARAREFAALNDLAATVAVRVPEPADDMPEAVPFLLFNPRPVAYRGPVELETNLDYRPLLGALPGDKILEVRDENSLPVPFQEIEHEHHCYPEILWRERVLCPVELPPFGWKVMTFGYVAHPEYAPEPAGTPAAALSEYAIGNGELEVRAVPGSYRIELLRNGEPFAGDGGISFALYRDPWGSWGDGSEEFDGIHLQELVELWRITESKVLETGPERAALWVRFSGGRSQIELTLRLNRDSSRLEGAARIIWLDRAVRLKMRMPQGERVVYDVAGAEVTRGETGQVPGVRYARVFNETPYSFAADASYGFDNEDGFFTLTLSRGTRYSTSTMTSAEEFPEHAMERGELKFHFLLATGSGAAPALADELEFPPVAILTWPHPGKRPGSGSLLELPVENADDVELVTLEQSAPGTLLATLQNRTLHPVAVSGAETLPPWQLHQCTITRK